jgi:Tol biopolymer transport system component
VNKITNDDWIDSDPAWSPDGARIAFTTNRAATDGRSYIALISPNGGGFTRLVPGRRPAWSPDGRRIVFVGGSDAPGLYVVNVDGSGLARITDDPADNAPSWGP